jgi:hypothetical protein
MNSRKILLIASGAILLLLIAFSGKMVENVDNKEICVIQSAFTGNITIYDQPGPVWQNFGTVTKYKKSNQFWFSNKKDEGREDDESIKIRFNDGGHAQISGSVRWYMPSDHKAILKLHTDFGSQEAIEQQLVRQVITKSVYSCGPLMSSKESSAEKRNDLLSYIEDQSINGVYHTEQKDVKVHDDLTNVDKTVTHVEIVHDKGLPVRNEVSPCKTYSVSLQGLALNSIDYDKAVEAQIISQQKATMDVQTAIANSKRAEQDAITTMKQGEANAAKAKWEQEVIKTKAVTLAQQEKEVAALQVQTADLNKKKAILEGEGEAAKKRLIMTANGALEEKLAAYVEVQKNWAQAFADYKGNLVPTFMTGGSGNAGNNSALNFQDVMMMKAQRDLTLDLKTAK